MGGVMMESGIFSAPVLFRRLLAEGWTRTQIAERLGMRPNNVSSILKGYNPDVRMTTLIKWSTALGVGIEELLRMGVEDTPKGYITRVTRTDKRVRNAVLNGLGRRGLASVA